MVPNVGRCWLTETILAEDSADFWTMLKAASPAYKKLTKVAKRAGIPVDVLSIVRINEFGKEGQVDFQLKSIDINIDTDFFQMPNILSLTKSYLIPQQGVLPTYCTSPPCNSFVCAFVPISFFL